MPNTSLAALHTAILDAREGYAKAIEKSDDAAATSVFREMLAQHADAHADVHDALTRLGEKDDESGSFMATVHKTVISVRAAVTGVDEGALKSFADGEEGILERYDDALGEQVDPATTAMLKRHQARLADRIAEMRALAENAEARAG
ncbi:MAG: PA2169 family four-helix-bundle protein [Mesorhizobium sp.]|nr:PA2169 family four-helix-bundle protein [Mesorhizobium sp.]